MTIRLLNKTAANQEGAALLVALVALVVLTVIGVTTMGDVMNQSSVVRNEQFRQTVFYGASSELNVQINKVNRNGQSDDDEIIEMLLDSTLDQQDMLVDITYDDDPKILTTPQRVNLTEVKINGDRLENAGCDGESINKVNFISGTIDATATLDDGRGSIKSSQRQLYTYCWP